MTWGQPGVSKNLRISNGVSSWGTGGQPVNVPIQQTGILQGLRILSTGTPAFTAGTGSITLDKLGPWNVYSQHVLSPNAQAPLLQVSGYGLSLINLAKRIEYAGGSPDTVDIAEQNAASGGTGSTAGDVYGAGVNSGTAAWSFFQNLPIVQRVATLGGNVGYWPLQNPAMQLAYQFTPNSATASTPYNIGSTTAGAAPYLLTGNATATLASPTVEVYRDLWQVPASQQDLPPFNLVSTWIEEQPQGATVNSATSFTWQATPISGLLTRAIVFIYDGSTNNGVASSKLNTSNALQLTYDANTVKFSESAYAALARQRDFYGFDMPQGVFIYDLMGRDLTLADALNTNTIGNIKITANFSSALGSSNSQAKIIRQIISPLEVK